MRLSRAVLLALGLLALCAGDALAGDVRLAATGHSAGACHTAYRPGAPGIATTTMPVSGPATVDAVLDAAGGDWDLAVFDTSGRRLAASAEPGAHEVAGGVLADGDAVRIQACRRSGDAGAATVALTSKALPSRSELESQRIQLVSVSTPTRADKDRLTALGLDLSESGGAKSVGVVLHGDADRELLDRNNLRWTVRNPDLVAQTRTDMRADARSAAKTPRSNLPSGRDTYRELADYENELKTLAAQNPGLVKLITLPEKTWLGRSVIGIEITTGVDRADGKPAFLNLGVHHAREWPSGEHAMEWAYELIDGYKRGDARATKIVQNTRNIVVPIVNPDGFNASRGAIGAPAEGRDESVDDTVYLVGGAATGGEYRRKNCRLPDDSDAGNCATSAGLAEPGVDPNRNYGAFWGGPGADAGNPASQTYPGKAPFSEPESRNIQWLVSHTQVQTLITNHTTAGLVLRAPGLAVLGDPVDEPVYKALGDAMAKENGYFSQKSFELYDTTGTTEDWSYNTTGGLGFTFELYCGRPNYDTGDCDDPAFHPLYTTMIKEWDGTSPQADHVGDPRPGLGGYDGKGNREAYYIAAESTMNADRHGIIEGAAPAGATLRLTKQFKTETYPQDQGDGTSKPITFDDKLDYVYDVGPDGRFTWHVNPSTRPVVAKDSGKVDPGPPSAKITGTGDPATGSSTTEDDPDDGAAVPDATNMANPPTVNYNDHPFTIPAGGDNEIADVRIQWNTPATDWDVHLYKDVNGNGKSDIGTDVEVGTSAQGTTNFEQVSIPRSGLTPGTKYVLRVVNFAATEPYDFSVTFIPPQPFKAGQVESYTLTCELGGRVAETQQVFVKRGERVPVSLPACAKAAAAAPAAAGTTPKACVAGGGFRSASARASGRGVAFAFARRVTRPVTVDVFQQSVGRRVIGERLVARYADRARGFTWNGRANRKGRRVTDGYYFARYTIAQSGGGRDVRRVTLRRVGGRWSRRAAFHRPDSCATVRSFKLTRPVFGGRTSRPLGISYRLASGARVGVEVRRGATVVKRFGSAARGANRTYRLTLGAKGLRTGDYTVRMTVRSGSRTLVYKLTSRRL